MSETCVCGKRLESRNPASVVCELVEKNGGLIGKSYALFTRKLDPNITYRVGHDEFVSVGHSALFRAALQFDPAKGCVFSTYAMNCLFRAYGDMMRLDAKNLDDFQLSYLDRESLEFSDRCRFAESLDDRLETIDRVNDMNRHIRALRNKRYRTMLTEVHLEEMTLVEVGRRHGVSKERVRQIVGNAMKKLRKVLNVGEIRHGKKKPAGKRNARPKKPVQDLKEVLG